MIKFQSEAYQNFIQSHIRLNYYIKISTGAVLDLHNSYTKPNDLSKKINEIIVNAGERWTPTILKNVHPELILVTNDLAKSGIIWAYSAFDVFFKKIEGYLSSEFVSEKSNSEEENDDKSHKIVELYEKLSWNQEKIATLLPILKFYEALRHSVAHNVGIPSGKIIRIYGSEEFNTAIDQWKTKFPDRQISPPPIVTDDIINLQPHHPIMYSETCLRIAADINLKLLTQLGRKHYIERIVKKHLLETSSLSAPYCQNLTRYIAFHLNEDYKITIEKYNDVLEIFDDLDKDIREQKIKEYKKRYHTLKNIR
jgi:hypothetical protein